MIRVLHVLPETGWAGTEKQAFYLLQALPAFGVRPELAIFRRGASHERFAGLPIRVHEVGAGKRISRELVTRVKMLRSTIDEQAPSLLHSWLFESHLVALLAHGRRERTPLVLSHRAEGAFDGARPYIVATRLMRRRVELILPNSPGAETMARAMGFRREQIVTIPNGYPTPDRGPSGDPDVVKNAIGILPGEDLVLTIGRPNRHKGYGTLLAAMRLLRERRPRVRLAFAGSTASELQELGHEIPSWAIALGWREDLTGLIEAADCVAHPSDSEGQSNAVEEALLLGRPVVSTNTGGHVGTVRASGGKVVPTREPPEMATAIEALLARPPSPERVRAGAAGVSSIEEVARRTAAAYEAVLGRLGS